MRVNNIFKISLDISSSTKLGQITGPTKVALVDLID